MLLATGLIISLQFALHYGNKQDLVHRRLMSVLNGTYNPQLRPDFMGESMDIEVFLQITAVRSVSELLATCSIELYFCEYWTDKRLAGLLGSDDNSTRMILHESLKQFLWLPDTFLPNAIHSENPVGVSVTHKSLLKLSDDGRLLHSRRISVTVECPMDLSLYPFDQQTCGLSIESYGFPMESVRYKWKSPNSVVINENIELPQFRIRKVTTLTRNITLSTGTYSRLECCFHFHRSSALQFVQVFVPSTFVVVISWSFMWMERVSNFSDMISVLLGMTFLYGSHSSSLPKAAYIKAIDIYLSVCFIFAFCSVIKVAMNRNFKPDGSEKTNKFQPNPGNKPNLTPALQIVHASSVVFPMAFLVFCFIYFSVYIAMAKDQQLNPACRE